MSSIALRVKSAQALTNFLRRFSAVNKGLLLEVTPTALKGKTHTDDKSVVKSSSIDISDVFYGVDEADIPALVKVGIINLDRIIQSFSHFSDGDDVSFILEHDTKNDGDVIGVRITLESKSLTLTFDCTGMGAFSYISDEKMGIISDTASSLFSFGLTLDNHVRASKLCGLDSDNNQLAIVAKGGTVIIKGRSFKLNVADTLPDTAGDIRIFKAQFSYLDKEAADVHVLSGKAIFRSTETNTVTVIGAMED